jgi:hypothetical protein
VVWFVCFSSCSVFLLRFDHRLGWPPHVGSRQPGAVPAIALLLLARISGTTSLAHIMGPTPRPRPLISAFRRDGGVYRQGYPLAEPCGKGQTGRTRVDAKVSWQVRAIHSLAPGLLLPCCNHPALLASLPHADHPHPTTSTSPEKQIQPLRPRRPRERRRARRRPAW